MYRGVRQGRKAEAYIHICNYPCANEQVKSAGYTEAYVQRHKYTGVYRGVCTEAYIQTRIYKCANTHHSQPCPGQCRFSPLHCAVVRITLSMRIYSITRKQTLYSLPNATPNLHTPSTSQTSQTQHNDAPTHHAHTTQTPPPAPRPEKGRRLLPLGLRSYLCRCAGRLPPLRAADARPPDGACVAAARNTAVQRAQYTRPPGALGASLRSASPSTTELGAAVVCTATAPHRGCWSRLLLPSPIYMVVHRTIAVKRYSIL